MIQIQAGALLYPNNAPYTYCGNRPQHGSGSEIHKHSGGEFS